MLVASTEHLGPNETFAMCCLAAALHELDPGPWTVALPPSAGGAGTVPRDTGALVQRPAAPNGGAMLHVLDRMHSDQRAIVRARADGEASFTR